MYEEELHEQKGVTQFLRGQIEETRLDLELGHAPMNFR